VKKKMDVTVDQLMSAVTLYHCITVSLHYCIIDCVASYCSLLLIDCLSE
jgi:hypothetical protein